MTLWCQFDDTVSILFQVQTMLDILSSHCDSFKTGFIFLLSLYLKKWAYQDIIHCYNLVQSDQLSIPNSDY